MADLAVIGINFQGAPIALREKVSCPASGIPDLLKRLQLELGGCEVAYLSTCNRTELYVAAQMLTHSSADLINILLKAVDLEADASLAEHFYHHEQVDAVEHIMAVSASLNSMIVGETEILGQVKQAYMLAVETETAGPTLHRLFHAALRSAKRVHTETDIAKGKVSISSVTVEFAKKVFGDLKTKTVMIVGAGETGELTLKSLVEMGVSNIYVANRSLDKGEEVAALYGGKAIQFDLLADYLPRADIVISSTSAPHYVVDYDTIHGVVKLRHGRPLLLLDIAVPHDIDPKARDLADVYYYDIDDLEGIAEANLSKRQGAVDQAWGIVRQQTQEWVEESSSEGLGHLMKALDSFGAEIKEAELKRVMQKQSIVSLPEPVKAEIESLLDKMMGKVLHGPKVALREAKKDGQWHEYSRIARHMFGIDEEKHD